MAEEELVTAEAASPTAAADTHKRKLEDFELNSLPETEPIADPESANNATDGGENGGVDESEAKRPRLETNGDNATEADVPVSQNGHQEEHRQDDAEETKPNEEEAEQSEPATSVEDQDSGGQPQESLEKPELNENVETEIKSADDVGQAKGEAKEPSEDLGQTKTEVEEPSENLGQTKAEVEESNEELPREGDVPIASSDSGPGDTQILSRKMEVPNDKVGVLIGKAGDTIRSLQDNSGAKIQIVRDADADPRSATRPLELVGTLDNINKAEKLIKDVIAEADAGGSPSLVARGFNTAQAASGGEQIELQVPLDKVGLIIGKGGETIRNLQTRSGARIQLIQQNLSTGDQSKERTVRVTGNKKQIEIAREMIKDAMNQTVRPSPLSGGYNQQGFRPRGPVNPQWGPRGSHSQYSGYDYPQRGTYPSQASQYPPPAYSNYPPQGPRSNFGPSWEQRPPASMHGPSPQGNYHYGQHQGPGYGHPPSYSQQPAPPYGHGYNEVKYDNHATSQIFGQAGPQSTPHYPQGGMHSGYGAQDQYGRPPMYGMQQPSAHSQPYVQPRPSQPGEVAYQGPVSSNPQYVQNVPTQQSYPYAPAGPTQQTYPPYGPAPTTDGYGNPPATASATGYPPQGGQPVAGYNQPGAQQPGAYSQAGPAGGYGSYPTAQPSYAEQPTANTAAYGYQGQADPAYGTVQGVAATYPAAAAGQLGYAQPIQNQPTYDQAGGYANVAAPAGYGKSASPQPAAYPQYDPTGQMYGAQR